MDDLVEREPRRVGTELHLPSRKDTDRIDGVLQFLGKPNEGQRDQRLRRAVKLTGPVEAVG